MGRESTSAAVKQVQDSINQIISSAISSGVRTIHIEPSRDFTLVRFRRGTKLMVVNMLPSASAKEFTAQLKKLANLDFRKTTIPQYGLTKLAVAKKLHEFQVATLPVIGGEKITIEILNETANSETLSGIGLWGNSLKKLQQALASNYGLILITSPGLKPAQEMLAILMRSVASRAHLQAYIGPLISGLPNSVDVQETGDVAKKLKLLTPGKYALIGIGLVGSSALARQINDEVIRKKHIMAVLPASSTLGALSFWRQMVNEPLSLPTVVTELRVSGLCQSCKQDYKLPIIEQLQLAAAFGVSEPSIMKTVHALEIAASKAGVGGEQAPSSTSQAITKLWRSNPDGCETCNYTGFNEDIGIFEVLEPSDKLNQALSNKAPRAELSEIALDTGLVDLKTDALIKALRGLIDFKTLMRVTTTVN